MSFGIDISGYQGRPAASWFDSIASKIEYAIVQLWGGQPGYMGFGPNASAVHQLNHFRRTGNDVHGYIWLPPDDTVQTEELIKSARAAAGASADALQYIWLDIESGQLLHPTAPMTRLLNAYRNVKKLFPEARIGIYTSRIMWRRNLGSYEAKMPLDPLPALWEARYVYDSGSAPPEPPDLDWRWKTFGGWEQRAMLQYAGTVPFNGVGADFNVASYERLGIGEPTPPPPPPKPPKPPAPPPPKPPAGTRPYTVKPSDGRDGLSGIAQRELGDASRWPEIARLNNLSASYTIHAGQVLYLPKEGKPTPPPPPPAPKPPAPKPPPAGTRPYKVKPRDGADGLSGIAHRELGDASRWPEIARLNGLNPPYTIHVGQVLHIPSSRARPTPPPPPAPAPRHKHVIVKSGDYASKWFASEAALLRLNPNFRTLAYNSAGVIMRRFTGRDWNSIFPGERLRIA